MLEADGWSLAFAELCITVSQPPTYLMFRLPSIIVDIVVREHKDLPKGQLEYVFAFLVLRAPV